MRDHRDAGELGPDEVHDILRELMKRLAVFGPADVYVIGGAAIALFNPSRGVTVDVDGWIRSAHLAQADQVLADLEIEYELRPDWFNSKASGLIPPVAGPDMWYRFAELDGVVLFRATAKSLLAMKLHAARQKDQRDIEFLLRRCKISSLDEAEAIYESFYPGEALKGAAIARVNAALDLPPV